MIVGLYVVLNHRRCSRIPHILLFRHRFLERLTVNIGIVLVFGAFYLKFLRRS